RDLGSVLLVGGYGEVELDRPHDTRLPAGEDDPAAFRVNSGQHSVAPERARFVEQERDHEADTRARVDDGVQDFAEHCDVTLERSCVRALGMPLVDSKVRSVAGALRGGRHGWMIATRYRASRLLVH